ncbi:2-desacetyl-2-hydroxyethyl bacteriochlorophyllide A dehydrogenase [Catalinimonas alkaloidigena]|uniref:2-desacetyl-2-hydroxyethyl bacteriochlorophyllide A dehydrogenase n=1 Tax=Catalinimonas alkaloidigena TaxID=1075417 RepID=A0A1G9GNI4_9BACT|nr:zinc-binding alcohol dehydrogenase family protein [Catalinimonas alkaloidigena]SDL01833.1 2-desacetyl-2-hydroxyethyl bacteriochlorophyllide A dehydrogenase [Catalinimonas alkaloidigena]
MKTLVLEEPGKFNYTDTPFDTTLQPDEALLKVHRIGICGTDYHAYSGNQPFFSYPRILGHELGVEVLEVGSAVDHVKVGDKCSVEPYQNAQLDHAVRRGFTNCGENISVFGVHQDGGMREYIKMPAKYLHKSATLDYDALALVEPLGIGCHAVNRARVQADDTVLVVGAGPIGLATVQFATATGARTVVMDVNEDRLKFAKTVLPIDGTVVAARDETLAQLRAQFDGDLPTVVFDATGNRHSMSKALEYAAPAGRIVFIGLFQGDFSFHDPYFHKKELTLMASRNALPSDFKQIIRMMEEGKIDTRAWITHRSSFENMVDEFERWLKPESQVIKAVVSL